MSHSSKTYELQRVLQRQIPLLLSQWRHEQIHEVAHLFIVCIEEFDIHVG